MEKVLTKILLIDEIEFPKTIKHMLDMPKKLFPYTTKNTTQYKGNFKIILSELARFITNYQLNNKVLKELEYKYVDNAQHLSEYIALSNKVDFETEEARVDFIRLVDSFLYSGQDINIVHTYLYNFIGESKVNQSVLRNTAEFFKDVLFLNEVELENIFKNKESDHVLTKLIIEEIQDLVKEKSNVKEEKYSNILPEFSTVFREDLKFLLKHKDYFIANFELLLNYFIFMYSAQSLLKFEKFNNANNNETEPLYFVLEWESITKKRNAASPITGYKIVKDYAPNLFAHEYTLRLLSHNKFNLGKESKDILSYSALINEVESHGEHYVESFKNDLKDLIKKYVEWVSKGQDTVECKDSISDLMQQLFSLVKSYMAETARNKYGQSIDYLGQGTFLKSRGSYGHVLNMTYDFLILMTATIVKDERMPLKTLISEFNKRGIYFDRQSIDEIVIVFTKNNILDKKSDSGDVQYVKPIL